MTLRSNKKSRKRKSRVDPFDDHQIPVSERLTVEQPVVKAAKQFGSEPSEFRGVGFFCRHCYWTSQKRGFSGRQALRAHLKRHVRERRAVVRPLVAQAVVVMLAVVLFLVASNFQRFIGHNIFADSSRWTMAYLAPEIAMQFLAIILPALLVSAHWTVAIRLFATGRRRMNRFADMGLKVNSLSLFAVALIAGLPGTPVWPAWLSGFIVVAVSKLFLAPTVSRFRIDLARRRFQPPGYSPLFKAASSDVEERLLAFQGRIRRSIREGRIDPSSLSRAQSRLLAALGLDRVLLRSDYRVAKTRADSDVKRRRD